MNKLWFAIATMIGMIIGAGILGIPYAFATSGILWGILNLAVVGFFVLLVNLQLGEIVLRTKGKHQLTGYAEKYLGRFGKEIMALAMIIGMYGAMIAYLIGCSETLASLFGGSKLFYLLAFFMIISSLIYAGIKTVSKSEFFLFIIEAGIFIAILALISKFIMPENFISKPFSMSTSFLPFGVVLFAMLGMAAIPEAREVIQNEAKKFKKAILIATLVPIAFYAVIGIIFVAALGTNITEVATISLAKISQVSFILGSVFALLAMTTSYLAVGLALQQMYNYDYKLNRNVSFLLACVVPLIIVLLGVKSFVSTIGISGAVSGGLTAVLIIFMFYRAKKKGEREPEYSFNPGFIWAILTALVFAVGMILEIMNIL
ncbi:hypothetical protein KY308_03335 [Candidatus Woesearchaeota archaeon]|nr:hypothetical protein [Candidatus Woesearchaeota archaeon]